jgi:hypothetical protein
MAMMKGAFPRKKLLRGSNLVAMNLTAEFAGRAGCELPVVVLGSS